uniref:Integrase family protein n=1 Tax=Geobacter sp. (strain M21) TaxID=443144 RepID=C6E9I0_GEOSM
MTQGNSLTLHLENLDLPEKAITRNGLEFDPAADKWRFMTNGGGIYFNIAKFHPFCASELVHSIRKTLVWYLENRSVPYASITFNMLKEFFTTISNGTVLGGLVARVTQADIINYKITLDNLRGWHLSFIRTFFLKMQRLGYPGIEPAASRLLEELTIKGARKGWAVMTMDPEEGPFTNMELRLIQGEVTSAYGKGILTNRDYSLVWLFMALGLRPSQVADLKVGDLEVRKRSYVLNVPRVKQRGQIRRAEFKERKLIDPVGQVLSAWCEQVKSEFSQKVSDPSTLPIFTCNRHSAVAEPGFQYHSDSDILGNRLGTIFKKLSIKSPRTGELSIGFEN